MEALKELVRMLSPGKLRFIQLIGERSKNKVDRLYSLVHSGKIDSLDDIAESFFSDKPHQLSYARNLKGRLQKKLVNTLFLIEPEEQSSAAQKAYFLCYRNFAALRILSGLGVVKSFIPMAEKTLRRAKAYEFTEIVVSIARLLRRYYGEMDGDLKKYRYYAKIALQSDELLHAENLAEYYNTEFLVHFSTSRAANPHLLENMQYYIDTLKKYTEVHDSIKLRFCYNRLLITKYQIKADHESVIEVSRKAVSYFTAKGEVASSGMHFIFNYFSIPSYIHLGQYDEALKTIRSCLTIVKENTYNYYAVLFYQALLGFHSNDSQLSEEAISRVNLAKVPTQSLREQWRIVAAYVHFYQKKEFRLGKFLNEVPIFDQDKRGNKINILILQTLFLLRDQRYNEIISRIEALKQYTHRYLRKNETYRSSCFIKMLLQLPLANFHRVAVERKTKTLREKLAEIPINLARQGSELEIIPYEQLWEKVLLMLDEKAYSNYRL